MAVKWIGDVAEELGLDVLDAVEFLASKGNYPMNGLLDEERVQFLKLGKAGPRLDSTNPVPLATAAAGDEKPSKHKKGEKAEKTVAERAAQEHADGATGPITVQPRDKAEDKTAIIQNPFQPQG